MVNIASIPDRVLGRLIIFLFFPLVQNTQIVQYLIDNAKWLFTVEDEATSSSKVLPSSQSKNQLPPQYLERVKFIEPEGGQKQRPLSKR